MAACGSQPLSSIATTTKSSVVSSTWDQLNWFNLVASRCIVDRTGDNTSSSAPSSCQRSINFRYISSHVSLRSGPSETHPGDTSCTSRRLGFHTTSAACCSFSNSSRLSLSEATTRFGRKSLTTVVSWKTIKTQYALSFTFISRIVNGTLLEQVARERREPSRYDYTPCQFRVLSGVQIEWDVLRTGVFSVNRRANNPGHITSPEPRRWSRPRRVVMRGPGGPQLTAELSSCARNSSRSSAPRTRPP